MKQIPHSNRDFFLKILEGAGKVYYKLLKETTARNGSSAVERDGKVVHLPTKQLLQELNDKK